MADLVTLQTRLGEAEEAYHQMSMGRQAVTVVDQNGERVEYNRASAARLRAYINQLKDEIRQLQGGRPIGPLEVWIG